MKNKLIEEKLLLKPGDFKPSFTGWNVEGVLNPAAVRLPNKKIMLLARIAESTGKNHKKMKTCPVISTLEDYKKHYKELHKGKIFKMEGNIVHIAEGLCKLSTISHFRKIILNENGFVVEKIIQEQAFTGIKGDGSYGVEDPRITKIGNEYYMTYVAIFENEGVCTALAVSKDLKRWERKGIIFREQNKDVVLFPEKINGKYVALHRPEGFFEFSKPSIWISHSPDMIHWGEEKSIMQPRTGSWEEGRIGSGAPPIKTNKGWLLLYHGVKKGNGGMYNVGAALLDLKDPSIIVERSPMNKPLLKPNNRYEKTGFIDNVIFPTGAIPTLDGNSILVYSGGADKFTSVKKIPFDYIFENMEKT